MHKFQIASLAFLALALASCGDPRGNVPGNGSGKASGSVPTTPAVAGDAPSASAPAVQQTASSQMDHPLALEVFVENGPSMWGYTVAETQLSAAVEEFVYSAEDAGFKPCMNYVFDGGRRLVPAKGGVPAFIDSLKLKKDNAGSTNVYDLLAGAIEQAGDNKVAMLVSDFIFSPDESNCQTPEKYFEQQQTRISRIFKGRGAIVAMCMANFSGKYYHPRSKKDCREKVENLNSVARPFYVVLCGPDADLKKLLPSVLKLKRLMNVFAVSGSDYQTSFFITQSGRKGTYAASTSSPQNTICNVKRDFDNKFTFVVEADFSGLLASDDYICDASNWSVSDDSYSLQVLPKGQDASGKYLLKLSIKDGVNVISKTSIKLSLNKNLPGWVQRADDRDGQAPLSSDASAAQKTYGIGQLLSGVFNGACNLSKAYTSLSVNVDE